MLRVSSNLNLILCIENVVFPLFCTIDCYTGRKPSDGVSSQFHVCISSQGTILVSLHTPKSYFSLSVLQWSTTLEQKCINCSRSTTNHSVFFLLIFLHPFYYFSQDHHFWRINTLNVTYYQIWNDGLYRLLNNSL